MISSLLQESARSKSTDPRKVAYSIGCRVRIVLLRVDSTIVNDELESVVHEATIATGIVGSVAVHQLLLGEGDELAGDDLVDSLHCSYGGEGPATSW